MPTIGILFEHDVVVSNAPRIQWDTRAVVESETNGETVAKSSLAVPNCRWKSILPVTSG